MKRIRVLRRKARSGNAEDAEESGFMEGMPGGLSAFCRRRTGHDFRGKKAKAGGLDSRHPNTQPTWRWQFFSPAEMPRPGAAAGRDSQTPAAIFRATCSGEIASSRPVCSAGASQPSGGQKSVSESR